MIDHEPTYRRIAEVLAVGKYKTMRGWVEECEKAGVFAELPIDEMTKAAMIRVVTWRLGRLRSDRHNEMSLDEAKQAVASDEYEFGVFNTIASDQGRA